MGGKMSKFYEQNPVNYHCPSCRKTGKTPNLAGRFFLINDNECQCNGCKTIFPKCQIYRPVVTNAIPEILAKMATKEVTKEVTKEKQLENKGL